MTTDLAVTVFRIGFLVLLWLLVLAAVNTLRRDIVGTMLPLGEAPIVIGRSPACTLVLEDEYASSRHAALTPQSDGWWIEDLSSRNGTFIDDERLNAPRQLKIGDVIRIGQTTLELVG